MPFNSPGASAPTPPILEAVSEDDGETYALTHGGNSGHAYMVVRVTATGDHRSRMFFDLLVDAVETWMFKIRGPE